MSRIFYNKEDDIVYWNIDSQVSKESMYKSFDTLSQYSTNMKDIKVLQIDKNLTTLLNPIDNISIAKYAKKYFALFNSIKFAFVVNNPISMAFFILGVNVITSNNVRAKAFSTKEAALKWLNND